jgi:glycosyltransferase involved in cell wall biosynthesis
LWREIVNCAECGLLVNPLDPQAIADSIVYILEHPEEAEKMGRRGIKAVEKMYNWSKEEEKLLQLYKDLLE